ncbi:hypothetical protein HMPREF0083_04410 [Aneurinibacillus aneurinilyticus ATCC 12856]|uniref:Uncharacterized protein n=1 Tax=Aneurinibacillus aneurinilyticus ATCC 12856 TaxID=649747 RepID=U1WZ00_ANEAE|nr:hypothetical protein HMPREF0083_04410 [Aneurinibacillus aneurinilyticus ATCC 12856]
MAIPLIFVMSFSIQQCSNIHTKTSIYIIHSILITIFLPFLRQII